MIGLGNDATRSERFHMNDVTETTAGLSADTTSNAATASTVTAAEKSTLAQQIGDTLLRTLTGMHGETDAMAWGRAITEPTLPGTVERKTQDGLWERLTLRLTQVGKKAA